MSMIESLLPMSNNKYYEYGSPPQQQHTSFLLSPSSSSSIIKNSNNNNNYSILQTIIPGEEISTIFVVGFPDNMQEREFQNMFMFSPGFEAATLKVPNATTATTTMPSSLDDENNRKQIIGFAKFRTRLEALDAKEILNGKKIDQEKGCILKAEMAKKNLHTKKEIQQQQQSILLMNNNNKSPYEAFHSVPINNTNNEFVPSTSPPGIMPTTTKSTSYTLGGSNSLLGMMGNNNNKKVIVPPNNNVYPASSLSSQSSLASSSVDYPFLLHKLYNNKKTPTSPTSSASYQYNQQLLVSSSASTPILSKDQDYFNRQQMVNMMDQNPPCNTLYVGNLPINTNEEELRMIFSNCIGYKRLSFRTKSNNGPMCFVEFEDIPYATLALKELNGNPLSNSVKGGIRLSYSKNPLGVRQNIVPSLH